jgi:hypothetical protein
MLPPATGADDGLAGVVWSGGLVPRGGGDVRFTVTYPSPAAAWTAMLRCEDMLKAIRLAGEGPVREAFAESVAGTVTGGGVVRLPKTFRYAVATTPAPRMLASVHRMDNELGSVSDRTGGRD